MRCPRCNESLTERMLGLHDDIPTHECPSGCGAFYPKGSLDRLDDNVTLSAEALPYELRTPSTPRHCPRCGDAGMYRSVAGVLLERLSHPRGDAKVERCPRCKGFWLKGGMLERVQALVLAVSEIENRGLEGTAAVDLHKRRY